VDGWHLSEQARAALRTARELARGRVAPGSTDPLVVAILGQWEEPDAAGPALLRACGLTAEEAEAIAATVLAAEDPVVLRSLGLSAEEADRVAASLPADRPRVTDPGAEPRVVGGLRFVVDQAERIAAEARAPYVGTEHLVVAVLWMDAGLGAHELRRRGVTYARAAELLAGRPATERGEGIDPLEAVEVPTPAAADLDELARQQVGQHPVAGDGRRTTLHHLLALAMAPTAAARKLLGELGVTYHDLARRVAEDGARLVALEDRRPEEDPLEGWEWFDVTAEQRAAIGRRVGYVLTNQAWEQGVRFRVGDTWVMLHPGRSGLAARAILDRMLEAPSERRPPSPVEVEVVEGASDELVEACRRLLPQLSGSAAPVDAGDLDRIAGHEAVTLLAARGPGGVVGMLTLVTFPLPTGLRARIEDVVVDEEARGQGVGTALVDVAVERARAAGARTVDLTSRRARVAANRLYEELGFRRRDSNVYRYQLRQPAEG
jgi:GNAT superfamily N-acetyltransferase